MADERFAARERGTERHRPLRRAHALQGDRHPDLPKTSPRQIDSIGGQLDAFTAKEYASYYIKVLDEHLPLALDILSDIVLNPAFSPEDIEREKKVVVEEIKMVEDTPDDLVHEIFTQGFWEDHPLGRPILGTRETVESFTAASLRPYFKDAYTPRTSSWRRLAISNTRHVRQLVEERFGHLKASGRRAA